ncbi:MAG TPA: DNA polymerase III subunit gamma/tau [Fimbriimonas sp.]|nr:DNA polymerase III subunit gamma/tau [Fimbriimonas sp.]
MAHVSLYRKYRSQTFSDLIGQDHVVRTIQNGITSGRIAHSYLFTGPRGTGKTSTARLLAKALCCENGPTGEPDNTCELCKEITLGTCVDVIEMDAASESGVDEVREQIVDVVEYRPMIARYKVFIIDEVHDLSNKAFDALLKTIEEPPPHVIFILATTEYNKVPATIRSRCQKFEFHRASMQDLVNRLSYVAKEEGIEIDPPALSAIARMADGGYRDALTLLEQAIITSDGTINLEHVYDQLGLVNEEVTDALLIAIKEADVPKIMDLLAEVARLGRDPRALLESIMYRLADLTRASYQVAIGAQDASAEAAMHEMASRIGRETLLRLRGEIAEAHKVIRDISLPRLWLEAELIRLATAPTPTSQPITVPPRREPAPAPQKAEVREPKAEPKLEPVPATNGDFWVVAMKALTTLSKTLGMKLVGSSLALDEPNRIVIEFRSESFYEWVKDRAAVRAEMARIISELKGQPCTVELSLKKKDMAANEPEAVELPVGGERLEQLAREIFDA